MKEGDIVIVPMPEADGMVKNPSLGTSGSR